jgi:hypothetical protein
MCECASHFLFDNDVPSSRLLSGTQFSKKEKIEICESEAKSGRHDAPSENP